MSCESSKKSVHTIIEYLIRQLTLAEHREREQKPDFDEEKYNDDLRKAYVAHVMNEYTDISDFDELVNQFDIIATKIRNKNTKKPNFDTTKFDTLRKELTTIQTKAMIQGDDIVRAELIVISEKIAKL